MRQVGEEIQELTNKFIADFFELKRTEFAEISVPVKELSYIDKAIAFNGCLVDAIIGSDYISNNSEFNGNITPNEPMLGQQFAKSITKGFLEHNLQGFFSKLNFILDNHKKQDLTEEYLITSIKPTSFTFSNKHNDEKYKCEITRKDGKIDTFLLHGGTNGKQPILYIQTKSYIDYDLIKEFGRTDINKCNVTREIVEHPWYKHYSEVNSFFRTFYTVYDILTEICNTESSTPTE